MALTCCFYHDSSWRHLGWLGAVGGARDAQCHAGGSALLAIRRWCGPESGHVAPVLGQYLSQPLLSGRRAPVLPAHGDAFHTKPVQKVTEMFPVNRACC